MPLNKGNLNISFGQGVDTKSDPWQQKPGQMATLNNAIFDTAGLLQKRNGFGTLTPLVNSTPQTTLSTYMGNLTAVGSNNLQVLSADTNQWLARGAFQALSVSALPTVRTTNNLSLAESVTAPNGLICSVWTDNTSTISYQISDSATGQVISGPGSLPATAVLPRTAVLGNYFIIGFLVTDSSTHLKAYAIPLGNPNASPTVIDISSTVINLTAGWDMLSANGNLYCAYSASDIGGAVRITYLTSNLVQGTPVALAGYTPYLMSIASDFQFPVTATSPPANIWVTFTTAAVPATQTTYTVCFNNYLYPTPLTAITTVISSQALATITSTAQNGTLTLVYEIASQYSYQATRTSNLSNIPVIGSTSGSSGTVGTPASMVRSLGLASKAFLYNGAAYMLTTYGGTTQPTYFLIDQVGNIISKLAYANGGSWAGTQVLSTPTVIGNTIEISYLFADLTTAVNKATGIANSAGIYQQKGMNLAKFTFNSPTLSAEIGSNLNLSGGFLWAYDGVKPVEQGFHLYPEDIKVTTATTGGAIAADTYYYVATYEWTDAQGNIHRSAPSIPVPITTTGSTSLNTINVPYLRATAKTTPNNPARVVVYRYSVMQPIYYQVTSVTSPYTNSVTQDSVAVVDGTLSADLAGNTVLYTNGGVLEHIAAPACTDLTLFKSRLWLIDAEDPNLLWFSNQVIEATPVEMSDLLTLYVAPTIGAQGSTGPMKAISAMDDKLIIFKQDALYYLTGSGPDITGVNNDFSDPVYISGTVGCSNPQSIVFTPDGLMFQSDKGIWLLSRSLGTEYIGAQVQAYTSSSTVISALNIPGTNQVRFTMSSGITLMYDYYYRQWGTFTNIPAISSTLYNNLHTFLNQYGQVFQETPGAYTDNGSPVLMNFTTAWMNLNGLQGYERTYFFYLLGQYITPHKLSIGIAYDYNPAPSQTVTISPDNYAAPYGFQAGPYGSGGNYGGPGNVEQWRVFMQRQRCQAFQLSFQEQYDPSQGAPPGAGFTLSGLNLVVGSKRGFPTLKPSRSVG